MSQASVRVKIKGGDHNLFASLCPVELRCFNEAFDFQIQHPLRARSRDKRVLILPFEVQDDPAHSTAQTAHHHKYDNRALEYVGGDPRDQLLDHVVVNHMCQRPGRSMTMYTRLILCGFYFPDDIQAKRDKGQASRGKSYVEEEKRLLRELGSS